ncbi:diacylglycerol kinase family protein [Neobacillus dielmonensis]|uniref:diacylglycerol kinase family protein n=1 Tax=Neobacillus dielmonensis TaxID=1347369 RepID=UPI0005A9195D|nr:diacylglycerol kinase family protein [Neobacillus dielmonensis]
MASNDKQKNDHIFQSFSYAAAGIITGIKQERNMRFHLCSATVVLFVSCYLSISKTEWLIILVAIGGMFALELMNSAIERVVDLVTSDFHPLAKQAKDLAAGAVFVYALICLIIGLIIFMPYIYKLFK